MFFKMSEMAHISHSTTATPTRPSQGTARFDVFEESRLEMAVGSPGSRFLKAVMRNYYIGSWTKFCGYVMKLRQIVYGGDLLITKPITVVNDCLF
jgi:hypothetical protein